MRQLNEMALPRSPTVLPPKTLPRLRLRKMSSRPDMEPVTAPENEPRSMASRFMAIAFLAALGDSDQESSVTEPRFTMLPMMSWMRPRRSAFIVTPTFVVVGTVRDCCVISRAAGLEVRRPGDPATPDSSTPCSSRPFGTSCGVTVVCHPPASRSGRRSGLFDRDRKIN